MIKLLVIGVLVYFLVQLFRGPALKSGKVNDVLDDQRRKKSNDDDTEITEYEEIE